MMSNQEVQFLEDGPPQDFKGTTLQLGEDKSNNEPLNTTLGAEGKQNVAIIPWSGENPQDFFSYRTDIIEKAIRQSTLDAISPEDGDVLGTWLLTEISFWDNEKERLILLTSKFVFTIKYDFIAIKTLDVKRVPLDQIDTLIIGELEYPSHSLIPRRRQSSIAKSLACEPWKMPFFTGEAVMHCSRLNGLVTGVSGVVKGCLVRPLQDRFTPSSFTTNFQADLNANPLTHTNFEPRSRNMRGLRAMWNNGKPLAFSKKWNPFTSDIPWNTYTSHPLLWHKEADEKERVKFNVDDFSYHLVQAVEKAKRPISCAIEHKPILLENYVGLSSLIHNKNALGFFKVRGKFSF